MRLQLTNSPTGVPLRVAASSNFLLRPVQAVALLVCASATMAAFAGDPVTDAMQAAYAPYRVALFKTNGNSQAESQHAIVQAQQAWTALATQFGAKPPAPYERDSLFSASVAQVSAVYARAAEQISANQLAAAHETLEQARETMAELRHRNQVVVYSDHMNAYHTQMEDILKGGTKLLGQPQGLQQLTAQAGALAFLANRLTTEAPAAYAKNEEFVASVKAVDKSVHDLLSALYAQDGAAVKLAIEKVKVPYSKLFLKFG